MSSKDDKKDKKEYYSPGYEDYPPTRKKYNYQEDKDWVKNRNGKWGLHSKAIQRRIKHLSGRQKQEKFEELRKLLLDKKPE